MRLTGLAALLAPLAAAALGASCRAEVTVPEVAMVVPAQAGAAVPLAEAEIARRGWRVRIVVDTAGEGQRADVEVARAERVAARPQVVGVVGHTGSRGTLAAAPVYEAAGLALVVPTGTSRLLRQAGPHLFLLSPTDSLEGAFLARYLVEELRLKRVLLLHMQGEYGEGVRDALAEALAPSGVSLRAQPIDTDGDAALLLEPELRAGWAQALVLATTSEIAADVAAHVVARAPALPLVATDGVVGLEVLRRRAGAPADSMRFVTFWTPDRADSLGAAFAAAFTAAFGRPPTWADAMTYDALLLLARGAHEAGGTREAVQRWLGRLGREAPPVRGVTGPIAFPRDPAGGLAIIRYGEGVERRVWP